jgi:hypothetical protein
MNTTSDADPPLAAPPCSRLVLQRRYLPSYGTPKPWTEWHDHPEPHQIAWGPGQYATLEENMKAACEGYCALGQGCEFRMVRRTDETLWEYSANEQMSNNAHMHQQEATRHLPNHKGLTRLQN